MKTRYYTAGRGGWLVLVGRSRSNDGRRLPAGGCPMGNGWGKGPKPTGCQPVGWISSSTRRF